MNKVELIDKFKPLYTSKARYFVLTGGRGSFKSFHVSDYLLKLTYEVGHVILFTRWTMVSAHISIIPEFVEKLDLYGIEDVFYITKNEIINKLTGSRILFRGIKTGAGTQTASLKSIKGVTTLIIDEAEELIDEDVFDKIDLSIRHLTLQNRVILIMNPTTRKHWVYHRFFEKEKVKEGLNGEKDDVCYIHTTYLDGEKYLSESFLKRIEELKVEDPQYYDNVMLGGWIDQLEGVVFQKNQFKYYKEEPNAFEGCFGYIDVADEGTDYLAFVIGNIKEDKIYVTDVIFTQDDIDVSIPLCVGMIEKHKPQYIRVEANNQGRIFAKFLMEKTSHVKETQILTVRNTTNKMTRIIMESWFIKQNFLFKEDYEHNSDYYHFMNNIFGLMKDGSSKHDDAPDALAGLSKMVRGFVPHLFQTEKDFI